VGHYQLPSILTFSSQLQQKVSKYGISKVENQLLSCLLQLQSNT
jgi:hypothetical protein